ncbi:MAG: plastocyanin/azurin family copper-binding protein [Gemmatimonadales bacterium]|nr:plastocyanin/azurin family copper-binding protein [Gemmatimonadales bacterium]
MSGKSLFAAFALAAVTLGTVAWTRNAPPPGKLIVVKMIDVSATQYKFEPAAIVANAGDTVRFEQTGAMPHNVDFREVPATSKLGDAKTGPFLAAAGDKYDLVIDGRFGAGLHNFTCTPHEAFGMKGTLTVKK